MIVPFEPKLDGHEAMARDQFLLDEAEAGRPGVRLYTWEGPWVSLGRSQDPTRHLAPECPAPWVKRPTGGLAVLHGHDLTVGLALPLALIGVGERRRHVRETYRALATPLAEALGVCGVPAQLAESLPHVGEVPTEGSLWGGSTDCFAHLSPNDIADPSTRLKVCGCAMRIAPRAALVQASIPVGLPLVDPHSVFGVPAASHFVRLEVEAFRAALERSLARIGAALPGASVRRSP